MALREIATGKQYEDVSTPAADLVANGRVAKFLVDLRDPAHPEVYFVNANFAGGGDATRFHFSFAQAVLDIPEGLTEFNRVTYFTPTKRYAAGVLHTYFLDGATEPVYGLQFYPQDVVTEQGIVDVLTPVVGQIMIPGARFAFVATGTQQMTTTVESALSATGIEILPLDRVLGGIRYIPLNVAEAWGYLRIFPANDLDLTPADIPVFEELPLDLSVAAGVITKAVQDSNSHVNLKSKERGTPNMVLRDAAPDNARLAPWPDRPVYFQVGIEDFTIEASTPEEVAAKLAERNNRPKLSLSVEPEKRVQSFDELTSGSAAESLAASARFGAKAANLSFLRHARVLGRADQRGTPSERIGYDLIPAGFAVPLMFYANLVEHPPNADLRAALSELIDAENAGQSPAERRRRSSEVRQLFLDASVPPDDLDQIKTALTEVLPGVKKIKIRSSANAEDIPNFDGAGLHDSFAATVSKQDNDDHSCWVDTDDEPGSEVKRKVKPKSVACAVKGVYASLWNQRAIEERSFAGIDHATAAMGLAVVGAYDNEADVAANAVVITRVLNTTAVFGYSLSVQEGNNLVTNPDPGTQSELSIAALGTGDEPTSITITRFAQPTASGPVRGEPVLTRPQMLALVDVVATVERAYYSAKPSYYRAADPNRTCAFVAVDSEKENSLDLEFKILADGHLVAKQVREFGGR